MLIVLTGYMGSGKSLVGTLLAKQLNYDFIDLDDVIAARENMSIPELFRTKGEIYFRKKERFYLETVLNTAQKTVVALGGGTPCYGDNMDLTLSCTPYVVYLKAGIPTLVERLEKEQQHRPLIRDIQREDLPDFIRKHLFERSYFYLKASYVIAVDGLQPGEVVSEIARRMTSDTL